VATLADMGVQLFAALFGKPEAPLSVGWDEMCVAFCASAAGETSDSNEKISAAKNDSG